MKVFMRHKNDCYTACLATVLGLEYEQVPRFFDDEDVMLGDWQEMVAAFLNSRGYQVVELIVNPNLLRDLKGLYIAAGPSYTPERRAKGEFHAVVYKDGALWHDPKPNPIGVIEPEVIDLIVPIFQPEERTSC